MSAFHHGDFQNVCTWMYSHAISCTAHNDASASESIKPIVFGKRRKGDSITDHSGTRSDNMSWLPSRGKECYDLLSTPRIMVS